MTKRAPPAGADAGAPATADRAALRATLLRLGYRELFDRLPPTEADRLASEAAPGLRQLAEDRGEDAHVRFLAAEILFDRQPGFPAADDRPALAAVYAEALAQTGVDTGTWQLPANIWGLLYDGGSTGVAGTHLLALGEDAVPALRGLLGNAEHVLYEGSRDATTANRRRYRVKDIAAYYLGRITGTEVPFHAEPKARDREIDRLAKALP